MKTITLIHTVRTVLENFEPQLRAAVGEPITVHNIMDDFFVSDSAAKGYFTRENQNRMYLMLKAAELTGCDVIVVTCSTLTPAVTALRGMIGVPVIAIDDAMTCCAAELGGKVLVVATAESTVQPTVHKITEAAGGKAIELTSHLVPHAIAALKSGDKETHDRLVLDYLQTVRGYDVVVLAQASMAHLETQAQQLLQNSRVLASPHLCIEEAIKKCGLTPAKE